MHCFVSAHGSADCCKIWRSPGHVDRFSVFLASFPNDCYIYPKRSDATSAHACSLSWWPWLCMVWCPGRSLLQVAAIKSAGDLESWSEIPGAPGRSRDGLALRNIV